MPSKASELMRVVRERLGGPVLRWELVRAVRRWWPTFLRVTYAAWLLANVGYVLTFEPERRGPTEMAWEPIVGRQGNGQPWVAGYRPVDVPPDPAGRVSLNQLRSHLTGRAVLAARCASRLLHQQLLIILLLTPAVTAGAIGREKERNTLLAVFGTELTAGSVVTGKVLGRLAVLAQVLLTALPLLVLLAYVADLEPMQMVGAFVQAAVLAFALAGATVLCSVVTRRTSDAILACYALILIAALAGVSLLTGPIPAWLDPTAVLQQLAGRHAEIVRVRLVIHLVFYLAVGAGCLALAAALLRPACLRQTEDQPGPWLWAFRRGVGDDLVCWRERSVLGLAPLPVLRIVPTWLGLLCTLAVSTIFAGAALDAVTAPRPSRALREGDWAAAWEGVTHVYTERALPEVVALGVVLVVLSALVVGIRSAGGIAEERRRRTWEELLQTPLSLTEIVRSKRRGVVQAALPYVGVFALPVLGLAAAAGPAVLAVAAAFVAGAVVAVLLAAAVGMRLSAMTEGPARPAERGTHPGVQPLPSRNWG